MVDDAFILLGEDHRLIIKAVDKLFGDLASADSTSRQQQDRRLDTGQISEALVELGIDAGASSDDTMTTALVQAQVAMAAGGACLAYPVLETLLAQALAPLVGGGLAGTAFATDGLVHLHLRDGKIGGSVTRVAFAERSDAVLVPVASEHGTVLARLPLDAPEVSLEPRTSVEPDYPLHDATLSILKTAPGVELLGCDSPAPMLLARRSDLLAAAELAGACRRMVEMTREHLLSRTQFGQVLGSYQALKHRLADAHVRVEATIATINYAAAASDADAPEADALVGAAKLFAGGAGKIVSETAMQLHGAIGYTMEYPLHLLMRRVFRLSNSFSFGQALEQALFSQFKVGTHAVPAAQVEA